MKTPTTLFDIIDSIHNPPSDTANEIRSHLETLKGPRRRGSTTLQGLDALTDRRLQPIENQDRHLIGSGSIAWFVELSDKELETMSPQYGAMPLHEFSHDTKISCVYGQHGWELVTDYEMLVALPIPRRIYIIWSVGDNCVATWHPGLPCVHLRQTVGVKF